MNSSGQAVRVLVHDNHQHAGMLKDRLQEFLWNYEVFLASGGTADVTVTRYRGHLVAQYGKETFVRKLPCDLAHLATWIVAVTGVITS